MEAHTLKETGIEAVFPAGRFDYNLNIVEGNRRLQELMGPLVYYSLYKMIHADDLKKFMQAVENCKTSGQDATEYARVQTAAGTYEHFLISLSKCDDEERLYIELFNMSQNRKKIVQINDQLSLARDYLTLVGDILSEYHPATDSFRLYWLNSEQTVELYNMPLNEWKKQIIEQKQIAKEDLDIFSSVCESMKKVDDIQYHAFTGSIFTNGEHFEKYQLKLWRRQYTDEAIVLGLWTVLADTKQTAYSNYVGDSYIDSLTQLLNKKAITEYAQRTVEGNAKQLAVAVMDIDNFKNVNDTYGHMFGDQVIHQTADVIKKVIKNHGAAGRIGGDEFMFILENFEDEVNLRNYLRSIKQHVSALFQNKMGDTPLSCSIGVARHDVVVTREFKELFMAADKALYIAKQKGKNRYIIYKPELHGQFNLSDSICDDMLEIRKSYYSAEDIREINRLLSETVLHGKNCLPALLAQASHTLMTDRISIFWKTDSEPFIINSDGNSEIKANADTSILQDPNFLKLFKNNMNKITNRNNLEYNYPDAYQILKDSGVLSAIQYLLLDENGEIKGLVTGDICDTIHTFPTIAIQIFQNMCQIINAVLIRD